MLMAKESKLLDKYYKDEKAKI